MQRDRAAGGDVTLYLVAVTGLAGVSILLLYLLYSAAIPGGFTGFFDAPGATIADNPRGVALVVATVAAILSLVTTVVAFGARVTNRDANVEHRNDG